MFEMPKIVYQEIKYYPRYAHGTDNRYSNNSTFFIGTASMRSPAVNSPTRSTWTRTASSWGCDGPSRGGRCRRPASPRRVWAETVAPIAARLREARQHEAQLSTPTSGLRPDTEDVAVMWATAPPGCPSRRTPGPRCGGPNPVFRRGLNGTETGLCCGLCQVSTPTSRLATFGCSATGAIRPCAFARVRAAGRGCGYAQGG